MARTIPFLFCRYSLTRKGAPLSASETIDLLSHLRAKRIAYRVPNPVEDDHTTFLIKPRDQKLLGYQVVSWEIAQDVRTRLRTRYIHDEDETVQDLVETDELKKARVVAIPQLLVLAVEDRVSEYHLSGLSALSRTRQIVLEHGGKAEFDFNPAGTQMDLDRALQTWSLDKFDFTVRPFNPTVRKYGETLHELMVRDGAGRLTGRITPMPQGEMHQGADGIISEAKGLSDAGYGQYGATGTTPEGFRAALSKPKFDMSKEINQARQAEGRTLKVYIGAEGSQDAELKSVVRALVEMYGPDE